MNKKIIITFFLFSLAFCGCKVTLITGYDSVVDETATKLKKDFNLFFIKLSRNLCTQDSGVDQKATNFQDYYDNMEVDLKIIKDRAIFLGSKSDIVKNQIKNLDSLMHVFRSKHEAVFKDINCDDQLKDDKHDMSDAVNMAIDALTKLQEELKATGTIKSNN